MRKIRIINALIVNIVLLNKPTRKKTENHLREFKAERISLNKVREIKSREFKTERK